MRLIKLGPTDSDLLEGSKGLQHYFRESLWTRDKGIFYFDRRDSKNAQISKSGLNIGDLVLFQFDSRIWFTALAASGRFDVERSENQYMRHGFQVNPNSLYSTLQPVPIKDFEESVRLLTSYKKTLFANGWNKIPDNEKLLKVVDEFRGEKVQVKLAG